MSTRMIYIEYDKSEALEREIEVFQQWFGAITLSATDYLSNYPTPESYIREYMLRIEGLELQRQAEKFEYSCRVLDIGVGRGESSIYLASQGHIVSVVEPSPDLCKLLKSAADLYGLSLTIYNCNAESIDKIERSQLFDVVIFNSSFHHCDRPLKALENCSNLLAENGKILLVNEPILQFYRTKKWFYTRLQTHPAEMGHYGGNEHNYRYHEYIKMLKSVGFSTVKSEPNIGIIDYQKRIQQAELRISQNRPRYKPIILRFKKLYYYWVSQLSNGGLWERYIFALLKHLSIIPTTFIAIK